MMRRPFTPRGPFFPLPLKKVKFFIHCAILMKFEKQNFHIFTNNNWDKNVSIGAPLPPGGLSLLHPQQSQILHLLVDFDKIWKNIYICLPIIITIEIYDEETLHPPGAFFPPTPQKSQILH